MIVTSMNLSCRLHCTSPSPPVQAHPFQPVGQGTQQRWQPKQGLHNAIVQCTRWLTLSARVRLTQVACTYMPRLVSYCQCRLPSRVSHGCKQNQSEMCRLGRRAHSSNSMLGQVDTVLLHDNIRGTIAWLLSHRQGVTKQATVRPLSSIHA